MMMELRNSDQPLLKVRDLVKHFYIRKKGIIWSKISEVVHACDAVSFDIREGETLGLVGESGCGKTTLAKCILHLILPDSGQVIYRGKNISDVFKSGDKKAILQLRREMQMIYQSPYTSLDPRMVVYDIITEPLVVHRVPKDEYRSRFESLIKEVSLESYYAERYPHEFSGGQRQRIVIARTLAVEPKIILADEPVASLDVSVRAQILNLMKELQQKKNLTYLYISHDLSSVRYMCDRVAIMYLGQIVELADRRDIFNKPLHPYTASLIAAIPTIDHDRNFLKHVLKGEVPSPINPPSGCRFHTRCPYASEICQKTTPQLRLIHENRLVACHKA